MNSHIFKLSIEVLNSCLELKYIDWKPFVDMSEMRNFFWKIKTQNKEQQLVKANTSASAGCQMELWMAKILNVINKIQWSTT